MTDGTDFWRVVLPAAWPSPPSRLSFSALAEIETCPRRWALSHGNYDDLWDGKGYPHRPTLGALSGRIAHLAIERTSRALNDAEDSTPAGVVVLLRSLGGISRVISECISEEIDRLSGNPRAQHRSAALELELRGRIPELRLVVQSALSRALGSATDSAPSNGRRSSGRTALGTGYHSEVELAPDSLAWVGYADAIRLTEDVCEVIDYKTGSASPSLEEQVRLYALLWARDLVVNPTGRPATRLQLVYPATTQEVAAPTGPELDRLELEMIDRARVADLSLRKVPPDAIVSADGCRFCDVKALCTEYWTPRGQSILAVPPEPRTRSVQVVVSGHRGDAVMMVTVELDPFLEPGSVVVVTRRDSHEYARGDRLRMIDVHVADDPELGSAVVSFGPQSEVFLAPTTE